LIENNFSNVYTFKNLQTYRDPSKGEWWRFTQLVSGFIAPEKNLFALNVHSSSELTLTTTVSDNIDKPECLHELAIVQSQFILNMLDYEDSSSNTQRKSY
jgi:hypothetical protein